MSQCFGRFELDFERSAPALKKVVAVHGRWMLLGHHRQTSTVPKVLVQKRKVLVLLVWEQWRQMTYGHEEELGFPRASLEET